jgi:hypothetical protein
LAFSTDSMTSGILLIPPVFRLAGIHLLLGLLGLAARAAGVHKRALEMLHLHVITHVVLPHVTELETEAAHKACGGRGAGVLDDKLQQVSWVRQGRACKHE